MDLAHTILTVYFDYASYNIFTLSWPVSPCHSFPSPSLPTCTFPHIALTPPHRCAALLRLALPVAEAPGASCNYLRCPSSSSLLPRSPGVAPSSNLLGVCPYCSSRSHGGVDSSCGGARAHRFAQGRRPRCGFEVSPSLLPSQGTNRAALTLTPMYLEYCFFSSSPSSPLPSLLGCVPRSGAPCLGWHPWSSELPVSARSPDRRKSQLSSELSMAGSPGSYRHFLMPWMLSHACLSTSMCSFLSVHLSS